MRDLLFAKCRWLSNWLVVLVVSISQARDGTTLAADGESKTSGSVAVRVVSPDQSPVGGARVDVFDFETRAVKHTGHSAHSDSAGRVVFDGLDVGARYDLRIKSADGRIGYRRCLLTEDDPQLEVDVVVEPPIHFAVVLRDAAGEPISGATLWTLTHNGLNAMNYFDWPTMTGLDPPAEPSNKRGELRLPPLPAGRVDFVVFHPDFAPRQLENLAVNDGDEIDVRMEPGTKVTVEIARASGIPSIEAIGLDLRHIPFEYASTLIGPLPGLRSDGTAEFTVAPGDYEWAQLKLPNYVIVPIYAQRYGRTLADPREPMTIGAEDVRFKFLVLPKTKVRGRVVDAESGKAVAGRYVTSNVSSPANDSTFAKFASPWSYCSDAETNDAGEYELEASPGMCRIEFSGDGLAEPWRYDLEVADDGSTVVPDFRVRPIPKVRGIVLDEHSQPVVGAIVRFRNSLLTFDTPVATDAQGRFELAPPWIPTDLATNEQIPIQPVAAFHPTEALHALAEVNLTDAASAGGVQLRLEQHSPESLLTDFPGDIAPTKQPTAAGEGADDQPEGSLIGKPAPELNGAHWLNTGGESKSLADFRDKYVLLQFWATWCGPCHADMPTLKLLQRLYGDRSLVIVGVHDNSMPLEAIEKDVAKNALTYPIVIDQPEGPIFARYRGHGVSGYPSYILVGRDGRVVNDGKASPRLRPFLVEIVRQHLLDGDQVP